MALDKDKLGKLELDMFKFIDESFKEFGAGLSMPVFVQFVNGFYLIRNLHEEFSKTKINSI